LQVVLQVVWSGKGQGHSAGSYPTVVLLVVVLRRPQWSGWRWCWSSSCCRPCSQWRWFCFFRPATFLQATSAPHLISSVHHGQLSASCSSLLLSSRLLLLSSPCSGLQVRSSGHWFLVLSAVRAP